jgi:hypothetical protein
MDQLFPRVCLSPINCLEKGDTYASSRSRPEQDKESSLEQPFEDSCPLAGAPAVHPELSVSHGQVGGEARSRLVANVVTADHRLFRL